MYHIQALAQKRILKVTPLWLPRALWTVCHGSLWRCWNTTCRSQGRGWREKQLDGESSDHRKESFAKVYDNNEWGGIKSGGGSLLRNAKQIIKVLNNLVERMKKDLGKEQIT